MSATHPLIATALAKPRTHVVLTKYEGGAVKRHETASLAQAENWAIGERRKIGRVLFSHDLGVEVRVVSVEIVPIARIA